MASVDRKRSLSRAEVRQQIMRSFVTATQGVIGQTSGTVKLAAEGRLRAALHGPDAIRAGLVSDLRARSRVGVNHKEVLAVLSVDMRGSTALAMKHDAEKTFVLMQCFIPLMAFVAVALNGEVVGLRGDGLIAAFGFGATKWSECINSAYEAGMLMLESQRDELTPFLRAKGYPTPMGAGVGVDTGTVTITKIGLGDAVEVTAYGTAVNVAAKNCKLVNQLWLSPRANAKLHNKENAGTFSPNKARLR
jgi:class 3 adenylate cyclase